MTIGDFKKLSAMFNTDTNANHLSNPDGLINVVVLQRGFVYVGRVYINGSEVRIKDASCIRNWGTTKGLGQLVLNGPTDKTVLDPIGEIIVHELAVVSFSPCNQVVWKCKLTGL